MTDTQRRIALFTKLMNEIPDTEPNKEALVKAYEEHIESIRMEEQEEED